MRDLKIDEMIRFSAMDDFTGEEIKLIGTIIGNHEAIKKHYPEEYGEASNGLYLVKVGSRSGLYIVNADEVLKILKKEEQ